MINDLQVTLARLRSDVPEHALYQGPGVEKQSTGESDPQDAIEAQSCIDSLNTQDLKDDLDQLRPWILSDRGSLDCEDTVNLKRIISKYAYLAFRERKEALNQERYEHLKAERLQEYEQCLSRASREYDIILIAVTKIAAEHIGLNEQSFQISMQAVLADPESVA